MVTTLYAAASTGWSVVGLSVMHLPPAPSIAWRALSVNACALTVIPFAVSASSDTTTFFRWYLLFVAACAQFSARSRVSGGRRGGGWQKTARAEFAPWPP